MANPLAALYNNPLNWEQSRPAMGTIEAMAGMPDLYRQAAQQQYSHQPMADSFLRRFGQPMIEQQQQSPMQPDMLQALMAEGNMLHALGNQDAQDAGTSFMQNARGGEGLAQYSGKLADQPWLDEFAAAGRAGVDLPMLQGHAGPQSDAMKAGIAERRQQRLGEQVPMKDRQAAVRQKALIKSEQRAGRMGDISPQEQFFNQAGRFAGGMGEGGGDFLNGIFFGPEAMTRMAAVEQQGQEAQQKANLASNPDVLYAQGGGMQGWGMSYPDFLRRKDPGFAIEQKAATAPDFQTFVAQMGGDWDTARQEWMKLGKPDPGPKPTPATPMSPAQRNVLQGIFNPGGFVGEQIGGYLKPFWDWLGQPSQTEQPPEISNSTW